MAEVLEMEYRWDFTKFLILRVEREPVVIFAEDDNLKVIQ